MKTRNTTFLFVVIVSMLLQNCGNKLEEKGFPVAQADETDSEIENNGLRQDSMILETRPGRLLLTGIDEYRLTPIYKVNYNNKKISFIGSNNYHESYIDFANNSGNNWHYNYMPGLEAVYGYNMINISHYNIKTQKVKTFFPKPVLIKTLYYPSFSKDTLNFMLVKRNYYMVSAYDEDSNKDGFVNVRDLRHFYLFDIEGDNASSLVPLNYSVLSSQYDNKNDFMYVYAQLDKNENGPRDEGEEIHVFWIDLKDPKNTGRMY